MARAFDMDGEKTKEPEVLMHFTTLESLFRMFEWGGIPLYDASHWDDLVDRSFFEKGCELWGAKRYGVMCFMDCIDRTKKKSEKDSSKYDDDAGTIVMRRETYAHWSRYAGAKNTPQSFDVLKSGIRIDFKKEWLQEWSRRKKNVILDEVKYLPLTKMKKLRRHKELVLAKRYAYEWENETRLVIRNQTKFKKERQQELSRSGVKAFIEVRNWNEAVQQIVFSPFIKPCNLPNRIPCVACVRTFAKECLIHYCERQGLANGTRKEMSGLLDVFLKSGNSYRSGVLDHKSLLESVKRVEKQACPFGKELECWRFLEDKQ